MSKELDITPRIGEKKTLGNTSFNDYALGPDTLEQKDSFEEETYEINGIPSPIHLYYLNDDLWVGTERVQGVSVNRNRSLRPMMRATGIMSVMYVPFMDEKMLKLNRYLYDQDYYGTASSNPKGDAWLTGTFVYKIMGCAWRDCEMKLGTSPKYPVDMFGSRTTKHWSNESKLFQWPYCYVEVTDYMNTPLVVRPDLIEGPSEYKDRPDFDINVRQSMSISGSYTIYVPYYKGDPYGTNEGMKSFSPMDLPVSSSMYATFMANNKSQFAQQNRMALLNALGGNNMVGQIRGMGGSPFNIENRTEKIPNRIGFMAPGTDIDKFTPNIPSFNQTRTVKNIKLNKGPLMNLGQEMLNRGLNAYDAISSKNAKINDLMSAPRNVTLEGGDVMDSIANGKKRLDVLRYHITEEYLNRLGDYFAMYGYRQDRRLKIDLRSRRDYNYIKTIGANIQSKKNPPGASEVVPKKYIEQIKQIFDNGITLWHMDRNGGRYITYDRDNTEV